VWFQFTPYTPASERTPDQGVSHHSAAALDGLGHLPADVHGFTLPCLETMHGLHAVITIVSLTIELTQLTRQ